MKTKLIDTYKIPDFYLNYIFNGETEGLTQNEIDLFDQWEESIIKANDYDGLIIDCPDENNQPFFTWSPDIFNLGCQVYDLKVYGVYKTWDM